MNKLIVGVKSGTFTLLTKGHVKCLEWCKGMCDWLIVIINEDDYLMKKKGYCAVPLRQRIAVVRGLRSVDLVMPYGKLTEHDLYKKLKKEYKAGLKDNKDAGGRQRYDKLAFTVFHDAHTHEKEFVPGEGVADRLVFCPDFDSMSTSDIMAVIAEKSR